MLKKTLIALVVSAALSALGSFIFNRVTQD